MLDVLKFKTPRASDDQGKGQISVKDVSIAFGTGAEKHIAVETTSIDIEAGEFVCILGPSGCGKSTLMNAIAGYVKPSTGEVTVDDKVVEKPGPDRGMVFQQYSLLPWKTVYENVAFGPKMAGHGRVESGSTANTFLELVGLKKFGDRYPAELSGGMQQRVGIARALANYPSVLLMDEPFGALDAQTRLMMQESLLDIWRKFGTTVVFVTHDVDEAVFLADRVLIMSAAPGRIIEDVKIDLPRPRSTDMASSAEYIKARQFCLDTIKAESRKAFESQNA
ncbi:nitrate/sulfonate/bicarbonate ABC transporter ATPase [Actibacterium atlanticum]|uniref:Nitrate/sulfonate/bicarbonate ABC transporter ATPase n=1 Tax=Actibacterium atlanticum TaxID=1461693 RepID=A0A058ZL92_9RHOB|nr:ABC transporter ATP-binding protein [Actibacterium atlanticum]KCV82303.1 nitrate/sulfonate/bicarbonate ABC transporter ATPase [Actibacterium atlanticum]